MKNLLVVLLALGSLVSLAQQSQNRAVGSFSGVKVAEGVDVYLQKGDKEALKVEVSGVSLDKVITEVSGSYLKIHMKDERYRGSLDVKVYVTYVKLNKLSASSAGSIFSDEAIKTTDMEIGASSAGSVEVTLEAENVTVSSSSAADVELRGKARSLTAEASSAGEIDAYDLEAQRVNAEASSAGSIKVNVVSDLMANASSGGSVRFRGNPNKTMTNSNSGGSVKKSN